MSDLKQTIKKILYDPTSVGNYHDDMEKMANDLAALFKTEMENIIGEAKPERKKQRILGSFSNELEFQAQDMDNGFNDGISDYEANLKEEIKKL